jgi:hypothetical protein
MLKGFTVPKSPLGQAALTPPPPWHYAGDAIGVEFWTDPDATAAILPNGLSPDPNSNGHAVMMFLDWQFTAQDDEYLEPARYQYREAFVLVDAMYRGLPVMWCPYIYVDNDAALARGGRRGFRKKMGSIFQTRSFAAPGPAAAPVASGGRFGASLSAHSQRLAEACVTLHKPVENGMSLLSRPTVLLRYFPRLGGRLPGQARGQRAGDVDHRQPHRCRRMGQEGRAQFSGGERLRTSRAHAASDRGGVPLFTFRLS